MDDGNFNERFEENLEEQDMLDSDPEEKILDSLAEIEIGYEEVLIQTSAGNTYLYSSENDKYEQVGPDLPVRPKDVIMEYKHSWTRVDIAEPIPGAKAYMRHF